MQPAGQFVLWLLWCSSEQQRTLAADPQQLQAGEGQEARIGQALAGHLQFTEIEIINEKLQNVIPIQVQLEMSHLNMTLAS